MKNRRFISLLLLFTLLLSLFPIPFAGAAGETADSPENAAFQEAIQQAGIESISLEAAAALLVDMDSGQILLDQDANKKRYPASITKIMTALLTLEAVGRGEIGMDTVVTVTEESKTGMSDDSSTANLLPGENVTVKDLLYCLLVSSANEAANILAITVAGDIDSFVEQMNQRAEELGMTGTHFVNPHGLHNDDHYTTAYDIYLMATEAMKHAPFREIVSTGRYEMPATNLSEARALLTTNGLLAPYKYPGYSYSGTFGIKTGSTGEAGYCLCSAVKRNGVSLMGVVLGCENPTSGSTVSRLQFSESRRMYDWAFANFSNQTLLDAATYFAEVPVKNSMDGSHVVVRPAESVTVLVPGVFNPELVDLTVEMERKNTSAPISAGDTLGCVVVSYDGTEYARVPLNAETSLSYSPFRAFVSSVNAFFSNGFVLVLLALAVILFLVGLLRRYLNSRKEERKQKRAEKLAYRREKAEEQRIWEEAENQRRAQDREKYLKQERIRSEERERQRQLREEERNRERAERRDSHTRREQAREAEQARREQERKEERARRERERKAEQSRREKERRAEKARWEQDREAERARKELEEKRRQDRERERQYERQDSARRRTGSRQSKPQSRRPEDRRRR